MPASLPSFHERVAALHRELGIEAALLQARGLRLHREAQRLCPVGLGTDGRDKLLTPAAAAAWLALRAAAANDGVVLLLISAFRGLDYQASLIRNKLARGQNIEQILAVNAPPGCSEHHTGRAVDIGYEGCAALETAFEDTPAFAWLQRHAAQYGYVLSYPRGNREGYLYEPWHWCHRPRQT